ncbi:uncharacterized protein LOC132749927 isoform X2 [Ruditapes philippinarum]|uniref:uncharacterized protein LOC132749927 isoform X2 n=1 Tax=Ruditapes philippinarum TaxID=129788 RepID=UPI00295B2A78|nr:uncharacterized protein LOC132749927 isoform X2 [Ruditapes philippinarum]
MYHNYVKESDVPGTHQPFRGAPRYQTQYSDDYNYLHERDRRQEEEWRRKRREEEAMLMRDKPKTFEYTAPYQADQPPRDINKYFHDSKYLNPPTEEKPDEFYFGAHAPFKQNPGTGMSTYERAFTSPRYGYMQEQVAGGLYIIRFADSGYDDVLVALRQLQPIMKANRGHLLGIARKQHVYPLEGDPEWWYSKDQHYRHPKIRVPYKGVEEAIAVFWFPYKEKAKAFYDNNFHNRFRDHNFPTTRSFEGHYIPLLTPPILRDLNTYLVIELLNAKRYYPEDMQNFQAKAQDAVLKRVNNCLPFVASALEGRESFKPGPLFDNRSKVFISRFDSMVDLSELWMSETIQSELMRNGLNGPRHVWAFSLVDLED